MWDRRKQKSAQEIHFSIDMKIYEVDVCWNHDFLTLQHVRNFKVSKLVLYTDIFRVGIFLMQNQSFMISQTPRKPFF